MIPKCLCLIYLMHSVSTHSPSLSFCIAAVSKSCLLYYILIHSYFKLYYMSFTFYSFFLFNYLIWMQKIGNEIHSQTLLPFYNPMYCTSLSHMHFSVPYEMILCSVSEYVHSQFFKCTILSCKTCGIEYSSGLLCHWHIVIPMQFIQNADACIIYAQSYLNTQL